MEPVFSLAADPLPVEPDPPPSIPTPTAIAALPPATIEVPVEINGDSITIPQGDRRYRIRGLARNTSHDLLKVNVLVTRGDRLHVDTLNLCSAQQRAVFAKQASEELNAKDDVIRRDLGRVILKLEELRDEQIRKALEPKDDAVQLSPEERSAAMELLKDPLLMERTLEDFARCGVVGEETNKKVAYLAAVSRLLDAPLAVIVQSSSAAGKARLWKPCSP